MAQVSVEHIELNEAGEAKLVGSRIKVKHLVAARQAYGYSAEQLQQEAYPHLSLAQVYAGLAYYYDHQSEIDESIKNDHEAFERERQKQQNDPKYQELIAKIRSRAANP